MILMACAAGPTPQVLINCLIAFRFFVGECISDIVQTKADAVKVLVSVENILAARLPRRRQRRTRAFTRRSSVSYPSRPHSSVH